MKTLEKIKGFAKEHKKGLIIIGGTLVAVGVAGLCAYLKLRTGADVEIVEPLGVAETKASNDLPFPDIRNGTVEDYWQEEPTVRDIIITNVKADNLYDLMSEVVEKCDIKPDDYMQFVIDIIDNAPKD